MLLPSEKNQWGEFAPVGVPGDDWMRAVHLIFSALDGCRLALEKLDASSLELRNLLKRSVDLLSRLTGCCGSVDSDRIRWLEVSDRHFTIHEMPLDISMAISPKLGGISREGASKQSWVFTSATLAGTNGLSLFMQTCGIAQADQIFVRSPFDYENQSCLYVPADFPLPSDPSHSSRVAMLVAQAAQVLGGRTLVLTTTLRAMRHIADSLRQYFHHTDGPRVMVQDDMPKVELIKLFGEAGDVRTHGFVLVASATFWEGLDVPGDALQLLVIDKLPFPPLTDPFVLGRTKKLKLDGKSPFKFLHLDAATVALQQGAGRLIRSESDRGILVVCDVRLSEKSYGKTLVSALPPMRRLSNEDEFLQAVSALTKPSTMDPDWI
jgi:ATP-dependent DNA helicase DinG